MHNQSVRSRPQGLPAPSFTRQGLRSLDALGGARQPKAPWTPPQRTAIPQRQSGQWARDGYEAPKAFARTPTATLRPASQPSSGAPADPGRDPFSNLVDEALKAAIRKAYHTGKRTLDYSEARRAIFSTIDNIDGVVECLYTGRRLATYKAPPADNMNVEHILPQSRGAKGEARSDLNDIAAADSEANERRGNLPYGNVVQVEWSQGGTKVGVDKDGTRCCEVRDLYKGNVARMMFAASTDYGIAIDAKEEAVLRAWAKQDPVDAAEQARSARVARLQGTGNFFVDYPWLIDRIKNL